MLRGYRVVTCREAEGFQRGPEDFPHGDAKAVGQGEDEAGLQRGNTLAANAGDVALADLVAGCFGSADHVRV
ncbi:hypothetical protein D1871_11255 [Nakamurella silvestris]|nr:hypothetical protein D1871_11255 [Nakamurella silvestris]